jgi:hypothetical protein
MTIFKFPFFYHRYVGMSIISATTPTIKLGTLGRDRKKELRNKQNFLRDPP